MMNGYPVRKRLLAEAGRHRWPLEEEVGTIHTWVPAGGLIPQHGVLGTEATVQEA